MRLMTSDEYSVYEEAIRAAEVEIGDGQAEGAGTVLEEGCGAECGLGDIGIGAGLQHAAGAAQGGFHPGIEPQFQT